MKLVKFLALLGVLIAPCTVRAHGPVGTVEIGSSAVGGGNLVTFFHFHDRESRVGYMASVGTTSIYSGILPGFSSIAEDDAPDLYVLNPSVPVQLEIVAVEGSASVVINGMILDQVGESATLGSVPFTDVHPEWRLLLNGTAGGFGEGKLSFRLTTNSPTYGDSSVYTINLTNGPLPAPDFDSAKYDKKTVACRETVGKATQKFINSKLSTMRDCLDAIEVLHAKESLETEPKDLAKSEKKATEQCVGKSGQSAEKTMLGKLASAESKAQDSIESKCSESLSADDISQTLGLASCRAEELIAAMYGNAKEGMAEFTVPESQGGSTLDRQFPCLHAILAD